MKSLFAGTLHMGNDLSIRRRIMVESQLRGRGIRDTRVLDAMGSIPREEFVPERYRDRAYADEPLGIGFGQTISQPYITALMAQSLDLTGFEKVLEVGAGSGYHAAVLGRMAARVIAVELIPELADFARDNLARTGLGGNIEVLCGDASRGLPEHAPFDAISVAAAADELPEALVDQLAEDGRMVIPVGVPDQQLLVIRKTSGSVDIRPVAHCRFVPLRSVPVPGE